jgi:hypothetical protein
MYMVDTRSFYLAFASLLALAFAGSYVLGSESWMAYLLIVPALLILRGLKGMAVLAPSTGAHSPTSHRRLPSLRVGAALVALSIPAALLINVLGLNDLTMWVVAAPTMILVTLFDREYFGWTDPTGYKSTEYDSQRSSRLPPTRL